jgi:hypothetical protein
VAVPEDREVDVREDGVLPPDRDSEDTPPLDADSFQKLVACRQAAWTGDYERHQAGQQERASAPAGMRCTCDGAFGVVLGGKVPASATS